MWLVSELRISWASNCFWSWIRDVFAKCSTQFSRLKKIRKNKVYILFFNSSFLKFTCKLCKLQRKWNISSMFVAFSEYISRYIYDLYIWVNNFRPRVSKTNDKFQSLFLTFSACFSIPIIFSNSNSNCSNLLDMRNLQKQVKNCSDLSLFQ